MKKTSIMFGILAIIFGLSIMAAGYMSKNDATRQSLVSTGSLWTVIGCIELVASKHER